MRFVLYSHHYWTHNAQRVYEIAAFEDIYMAVCSFVDFTLVQKDQYIYWIIVPFTDQLDP